MSVRPARLLGACVFTVGVLVAASGCQVAAHRAPSHQVSPAAKPAAEPAATAPASPPASAAAEPRSPAAGPGLSEAQARAALISETDLGVPWVPAEGIATWRDGLLKATTESPECQRLLDALYADELLGAPTGTYAVTALDDGDDQAQLRYQVAAQRGADAEPALAWLRTLPQSCAQFTATTTRSGPQTVQVTAAELPQVGNDRQGLRITLTGQNPTEDGQPSVLTLDVAVVRVGDDAIVLTSGALGTPPQDAVGQALEVGAQRLAQVREQGRLQA
ncbi:hypothetical protein [Streptomyces sp. NPDC086787]|uniref:hypothetical protein n=1 Tax=Streptomyces sp. NPDC086787 TaxID=3365759 RepID=UPI003816AB16